MATNYGDRGSSQNIDPLGGAQFDHIEAEVQRLVKMLDVIRPASKPAQQPARAAFENSRARMAAELLRERRLRDQFFPAHLFHEPAWDMLLDLYESHHRGKKVGVSSLCIAACVPGTTALRWISTMTDAGLFVREADPYDGRRIYIGLSQSALLAMDAYFDKLAKMRDYPDLI